MKFNCLGGYCKHLNNGNGCGEGMLCERASYKYQAEMRNNHVYAIFFSCLKPNVKPKTPKNPIVNPEEVYEPKVEAKPPTFKGNLVLHSKFDAV